MILQGLGGEDNVLDINSCATRLRLTVADSSRVNEEMLKQTGAHGVIKKGNGIQVIYGPQVFIIHSELEEYVDRIKKQEDREAYAGRTVMATKGPETNDCTLFTIHR